MRAADGFPDSRSGLILGDLFAKRVQTSIFQLTPDKVTEEDCASPSFSRFNGAEAVTFQDPNRLPIIVQECPRVGGGRSTPLGPPLFKFNETYYG